MRIPTDIQEANLGDVLLRANTCAAVGIVAQRFLARHHTVLQIGSTVFVHGGILPSHADYGLERINR